MTFIQNHGIIIIVKKNGVEHLKKYFSCHNHTDYSNIRGLDAIDKVEQLIDYALNLGLSGIAITDHETLSSHVKAMQYMSSLKDKAKKTLENNSNDTRAQAILDFKLAYGNEIYLCRDNLNSSNYVKGKDGFWHFILIAKDKVGHQQLRELSSRAWTHYFKQFAERVPTYYSDVEEIVGTNPGHLIASTACLGSQFDKMILKGEFDKALNFVNWCQSIFGKENFFIEFQPGLTDEQISYNKSALDFCSKHNLTTIVTTDTHYLKAEDRPIHKAFLNSNDSEREVDSFYSHTYMMDKEEILNLMSYLGIDNVKSMLNNTLNIYDKVEEYSLAHKQLIPRIPISWDNAFPVSIPDYPYIQKFVKSPYEEDRLYVTRIFNGLSKKNIWDEKHIERIEIELEQIWKISEKEQERLSNYFLTMSKIIDIIWESNSIVGPGRGSVFTHLCSYCLDIIQEDPLISPIPLPWWRFLSEERPEYPKISIMILG